jgi:hypothetical protein
MRKRALPQAAVLVARAAWAGCTKLHRSTETKPKGRAQVGPPFYFRQAISGYIRSSELSMLKNVHIAIEAAEGILPGEVAPDGEEDPRWQAIMLIEEFVEAEPEAILPFVLKWGSHEQEDLRTAIAVLLVEHLLEFHFDLVFPRIEKASLESTLFADTFLRAWKLGQAKEPHNSTRFEALSVRLKSDR